MKTFFNILTLVLIGLLASTYMFQLSPIDYSDSIEIETPEDIAARVTLKAEETDLPLNPSTIIINHTSEDETTLTMLTDSMFAVDVYKDGTLVKSGLDGLEASVPDDLTIGPDKNIKTTLDISQDKLGLDDGKYKLVIKSLIIPDADNASLSVEAAYDTQGTYIPAVNVLTPGTSYGLTIYYATAGNGSVIPVTKFTNDTRPLTRIAISMLQEAPLDANLHTVVNDVTNCTYNNGNIIIDLPGAYEAYNDGSAASMIAYESFVKTMFAIERYWPIYSVSFTIDKKIVPQYFGGMNTASPVQNADDTYSVYMAERIGNRYYLTSIPADNIAAEDMLESKAQKLFNAYKSYSGDSLRNPVPDEVIINNIVAEGNVLAVDFNNAFLTVCGDRQDMKAMMADAIIYTLTDIPGVTGIRITVEGAEVSDFIEGRTLTGIITQPAFINPEQ